MAQSKSTDIYLESIIELWSSRDLWLSNGAAGGMSLINPKAVDGERVSPEEVQMLTASAMKLWAQKMFQ
eukprot:374714-Amphidinium_carterae.1